MVSSKSAKALEPKSPSTKSSGQTNLPPTPTITPLTIFLLLLTSHTLAALYSPIQDCDEVYNYWEPLHYSLFGSGRQTWEYAPQYALRSWSYISLHALILTPFRLLLSNKLALFYTMRFFLGAVCAASETHLYGAVAKTVHPRVAVLFALAMGTSTGMFHASVALLPSSFAMYCVMWGSASFMERSIKGKPLGIADAIMWFGAGIIVGWPFAALLGIPFAAEELVLVSMTEGAEFWADVRRWVDGGTRVLGIVVVTIAVDWLFYGTFAFVPLNIVRYNVLGGSNRGPEIFGTEPWGFYIKNLLLNWNIWFLFALDSIPFLFMNYNTGNRNEGRNFTAKMRTFLFLAPFYDWLLILSAQQHKEERFMYPLYPFLAINGAVGAHLVLSYLGARDHTSFFGRKIVGNLPKTLKLVLAVGLLGGGTLINILRTVGLADGYSAPMTVWSGLKDQVPAGRDVTVCVGKEWYRFPSSFFLPEGARVKFVKSAFDGLLPGEFDEAAGNGVFDFPGARGTRTQMNDENRENLEHLVDVGTCDFLVDRTTHGVVATTEEPEYVHQTEWEVASHGKRHLAAERRFLDSEQTPGVARILWLPGNTWLPAKLKRQYVSYVLLKRRAGSGE